MGKTLYRTCCIRRQECKCWSRRFFSVSDGCLTSHISPLQTPNYFDVFLPSRNWGECASGGMCTQQTRQFPVKVSNHIISSAEDLAGSHTWMEYPSFPTHCECIKRMRYGFAEPVAQAMAPDIVVGPSDGEWIASSSSNRQWRQHGLINPATSHNKPF